MKKIAILTAAACVAIGASAQTAVEKTNMSSNWSVGVDGGVTTPIKGHSFFQNMRGAVGLHIHKQISPVFGLGVEGMAGINTSSWNPSYSAEMPDGSTVTAYGHSSTAFDNSYLGVYGTVNLMNLLGGFSCEPRVFEIEAVAGAGWGHNYLNKGAYMPLSINAEDENYFVTKAGLNFNFNVVRNLTISVKPYVAWNMTGTKAQPLEVKGATAAYDARNATFNCMVGVTYNFGPGFECVDTRNQAELDALNARINQLREELAACDTATEASRARAAAIAAELAACQNQAPTVVKEVNNNLSSVRYVFFKLASAKITQDQMPNVTMIADYLKNHPKSNVIVKGYASPEGNPEFNVKLAANRAEAVKNALVNKYKIAPSRIQAEGCGIGEMFSENSWNRVAICTVDAE